jgi:hypothetical protein
VTPAVIPAPSFLTRMFRWIPWVGRYAL